MATSAQKQIAKRRKQFDNVFIRHNVLPIAELNFRDYTRLAKPPPEGNLRISRLFLSEVERRGRLAAKAAGTELGGMHLYFKYEISGEMTGETTWKSVRRPTSYRLDIDYWGSDSVNLNVPRSVVAPPLYEEFNDMFFKPLGLPDDYELADFLVYRNPHDETIDPDGKAWLPMTVANPFMPASEIATVKNWA